MSHSLDTLVRFDDLDMASDDDGDDSENPSDGDDSENTSDDDDDGGDVDDDLHVAGGRVVDLSENDLNVSDQEDDVPLLALEPNVAIDEAVGDANIQVAVNIEDMSHDEGSGPPLVIDEFSGSNAFHGLLVWISS